VFCCTIVVVEELFCVILIRVGTVLVAVLQPNVFNTCGILGQLAGAIARWHLQPATLCKQRPYAQALSNVTLQATVNYVACDKRDGPLHRM
jgi:hypothetical protein